MITFIHTADIHFGVENYGRIDPKTGIHSRLLDFKKALDFCVDHALEQRVDFFLFSGDAYKTANPSPTQQRLLMQCWLRLQQAGIPVVIIVGNHDHPLSFGKANALDVFGDIPLDGFHVISKPTSLVLHTKNGPVQLVGIPWPTRNTIAITDEHKHKSAEQITAFISDAVGTIIQDMASKLDPTLPAILAGHLTVANGVFSGSERRAIYGTDPTFLPSQLAIKPFDYVGLGHLHRFQNLNPKGSVPVVYSGSVERVDFGERKEEKGFCVVRIADKKASYEFLKTPTRPFIQVEVKLTAGDQTKQLLDALSKHKLTGAVVKILYHVPAGHKDEIDLRAIQRACSTAMYLVGIIPVRQQTSRQQRSDVNVNMDLPTLLDAYFDAKQLEPARKKVLLKKAQEICTLANQPSDE